MTGGVRGVVLQAGEVTSRVLVYRSAACGEGCGGNCTLCNSATAMEIVADNGGFALRGGESVLLRSNAPVGLPALSALLYLLPLAAGLLGYAVLRTPGLAIGFVLGFLPAGLLNRRLANSKKPVHAVVSIVRTGDS